MGTLTVRIHLLSPIEHPEPSWRPTKHSHSPRAAAVLWHSVWEGPQHSEWQLGLSIPRATRALSHSHPHLTQHRVPRAPHVLHPRNAHARRDPPRRAAPPSSSSSSSAAAAAAAAAARPGAPARVFAQGRERGTRRAHALATTNPGGAGAGGADPGGAGGGGAARRAARVRRGRRDGRGGCGGLQGGVDLGGGTCRVPLPTPTAPLSPRKC